MNQVVAWLQQIIAAIIVTGFLEMLLPNNELKSVTKMIMGLIIIMLLIQPLVNFLDLPSTITWSLPDPAEQKVYPSTGDIIQHGLKLRDSWEAQFIKENRQVIEGKIRNIVGLIDGLSLQGLSINYNDSTISRIILRVKPENGRQGNAGSRGRLRQRVINSVQLLTDLPEEQIEVIWGD